jgi:ribosome biogenesis GTPase / thiamine phosphate phosphatase
MLNKLVICAMKADTRKGMSARRRKKPRGGDLTGDYLSGQFDEDTVDKGQRFSNRSKTAQHDKMMRTAVTRSAADLAGSTDVETLPIGEVIQVHSLFCEVESDGTIYLCVTRKTLAKVSKTAIVVGDRVRFREGGTKDELGRPEGVIEQVLPRLTILTRTESFKGVQQHPIVANAEQMLIVASLVQPAVKWGLVDRMLIAAQSGGLKPIVCLNKTDQGEGAELEEARSCLKHYGSIGFVSLETSATTGDGLSLLREVLKDRTTVLAGHSGVGKSTLIRAIQPGLEIRIGEVSEYTDKGRHTTTSARRYVLDFGGAVVDTPGVKVFGLWGVTAENLAEYFADVAAGTAPAWRRESYQRILESMERGRQ